jgi:hypothetical protein
MRLRPRIPTYDVDATRRRLEDADAADTSIRRADRFPSFATVLRGPSSW